MNLRRVPTWRASLPAQGLAEALACAGRRAEAFEAAAGQCPPLLGHVYICICVCKHNIHIYTYVNTYLYMCMHMYIYIHTDAYKHVFGMVCQHEYYSYYVCEYDSSYTYVYVC